MTPFIGTHVCIIFAFPIQSTQNYVKTGWNTKISARDSNYGTRIDYVLVTPGLLPWIKAGDILPSLKGSDHCPTYIDLHDEIEIPERGVVTLREAMGMVGRDVSEPPRLAAKFWEELRGRSTLDTFFSGRMAKKVDPIPVDDDIEELSQPTPSEIQSAADIGESLGPSETPTDPAETISQLLPKRKIRIDEASPPKKKPRASQAKLSSFFAPPSASSSRRTSKVQSQDELDADHRLALQLSQQPEPSALNRTSSQNTESSKQVWAHMLAPVRPPCCTVHNEPGKELTVTKPGPNKGKNFFICSRYALAVVLNFLF